VHLFAREFDGPFLSRKVWYWNSVLQALLDWLRSVYFQQTIFFDIYPHPLELAGVGEVDHGHEEAAHINQKYYERCRRSVTHFF
jgi:hypothetical protein